MSIGKKYYAVRKGICVGVFNDWNDVKEFITGVESPEFKAFKTRELAEMWFQCIPITMDLRIYRHNKQHGGNIEMRWQTNATYKGMQKFKEGTPTNEIIKKIQTLAKECAVSKLMIDDLTIYKNLKQQVTSGELFYSGKKYS